MLKTTLILSPQKISYSHEIESNLHKPYVDTYVEFETSLKFLDENGIARMRDFGFVVNLEDLKMK